MKKPVTLRRAASLVRDGETGSRIFLRAAKLGELNASLASRLPAPLADHVALANVRNGEAVFNVDSSAWAARMRYLQHSLIAELHGLGLPTVRSIQIRVIPKQEISTPAPSRTINIQSPDTTASLIESTSNTIEHEDLKSALQRLASRIRRR